MRTSAGQESGTGERQRALLETLNKQAHEKMDEHAVVMNPR